MNKSKIVHGPSSIQSSINKSIRCAIGLICGFIFYPKYGNAQTVIPTSLHQKIQVSLTLVNVCDASSLSAQNINFGTHSLQSTPITATGSVSLQCSTQTPYQINLDAGLHASSPGNIQGRQMSDGAHTIAYQLYQDASQTQPWGNTSTNNMKATGTGLRQSWTVYAKANPAGAPAGSYNDTVQVTVTY